MGMDLQAEVASDAVLEMDDVIALLQFGEVDVQQPSGWSGRAGDLRRRGRCTL